jgi:hypothetical protein
LYTDKKNLDGDTEFRTARAGVINYDDRCSSSFNSRSFP